MKIPAIVYEGIEKNFGSLRCYKELAARLTESGRGKWLLGLW